jgi:hypothetical protein
VLLLLLLLLLQLLLTQLLIVMLLVCGRLVHVGVRPVAGVAAREVGRARHGRGPCTRISNLEGAQAHGYREARDSRSRGDQLGRRLRSAGHALTTVGLEARAATHNDAK